MSKRTIQHIKAAVDCRRLAASLGIRGSGSSFHCFGAAHVCGDRHPSLSIREIGYHCFHPACGLKGDCFSLVQDVRAIGFTEAVALVAKFAGVSIGTPNETPLEQRATSAPVVSGIETDTTSRVLDTDQAEREAIQWLARCEEVAHLWATWLDKLKLGRKGESYLSGRALDVDLAGEVGVVESSGPDLRAWARKQDKLLLRDAGMAHFSEEFHGHGDWLFHPFYDRSFLVFPLRDRARRLCGLRFRSIDGEPKKSLALRKTDHIHSVPFLSQLIPAAPTRLIIVEGELNALSCLQVGCPAIAAPGAGVWPHEWAQYVADATKVVVLAHPDDAGSSFARKVANGLRTKLGSWCDGRLYVRQWTDGDANDALRNGVLSSALGVG